VKAAFFARGQFMQLPLVTTAPIVQEHAPVFRDLFGDERQYQHFQNYLSGLIVLDNKSLANISRCILESADKTNLSRFLSSAPWQPSQVHQRRIEYMMGQTSTLRQTANHSYFILDDTLCEHVGNLFEHIDRHYNHSNDTYPLAHNVVTSHYLSGSVRFPLDFELYRRYEEVTRWHEFVHRHFPDQTIPTTAAERGKLHRKLDAELMQDPEFAALHQQFYSKIDLAKVLLSQAIERDIPFTTVLMDSWYLSSELVSVLKEKQKDWVSLLKRNRNLEVHSFQLKDAQGQPMTLPGEQIKVEDLVPLIPANAYREVKVKGQRYWCFTRTLRIPSIGKVRLVISFDNPELSGTYAVLVSNRTDWSASEILSRYLQRWSIETFYRDSKQLLGFGDYRMRTLEAIQAHWCLVFVAYSLLHLACLPPSSPKSRGKLPTSLSQSIGEVCRQQGQALVQELILFAHNLLQQGHSAAEVFRDLFAKQQGVAMGL
jgi:SRSO17 transposase